MAEQGSSQKIISVDTIRDSVVVLKNGGLRVVIEAEGVNFELKSPEEQEALIAAFQEFLVGLDFSLQLMVYSRRINIDSYIRKIQALAPGETNQLIKNNIAEYTNFLSSFLEEYNVMNKKFYVVVSYAPAVIKVSMIQGLTGAQTKSQVDINAEEEFQRGKQQLETRISVMSDGLSRMGIQPRVLTTEELVGLFYNLYNPMEKEEKRYQ